MLNEYRGGGSVINPRHAPGPTRPRWYQHLRGAVATLGAALAVIGLLGAAPAFASELHVAVAANFLGTLQKLAIPYQAASGNPLSISAGSSGQLLTQIRQGAPFD